MAIRLMWHRLVFRSPLFMMIVCVASGNSFGTNTTTRSNPSPAAMFRNGPDHSGAYADSCTGMYGGVLWRKHTGGAVRSSPTVVGDVVLIGSTDGSLYALDAGTGHEKWTFAAESAVVATAAVAGGRVFFASYRGTFYAVTLDDGKLSWKTRFGPDLSRSYDDDTGEHSPTYDGDFIVSSPAVLDDTVVVGGGDGLVYAFNTASGKPRWTFRTGGRVRSSPAISNGVVYVGSYDGSLYAIDCNSGKQVWRYDTKGRSLNSAEFGYDRQSILSSPAVSDGVVYFGSRDAHLYAVDAARGTLKWVYNYEDDNMTWAISSPAVRDHVVYMGTADGDFVHALRAADGRELWRFKMPDRVWSSPVVAGPHLFVTNQAGGLYAVDAASGKERWRFETRSSVQSSPVVANGVVYLGSNDGGVYALRADGAQPMQRAVYWDAESARLFVRSDLGADYKDFAAVRDFLQARGYDVLVFATLADWMTKRISDRAPSVLVLPTDVLPAPAAGPDPAHTLFRQYLDSGGKIVWFGFPPMLLKPIVDNDTMTDVTIQWDDASRLLGISLKGALNGELGVNRVTPAGRDWGLADWWLGSWDLPIESGTTALALNDRGFAGAWVKSYGGAPGTGFVYVGTKTWDGDMLNRLFMVAEYRPRS